MNKRFVTILVGIVVIVLLATALYFVFFRTDSGLDVGENPFDGLGGEPFTPSEGPEPGVAVFEAGTEIAPRFVKITDGPVVPATVAFSIVIEPGVATSTGTSTDPVEPARRDTEIRYLERASGNVYAYRVNERSLTRLSNRTLPGIQEASWVSDGSRAFVRFLAVGDGEADTIASYSLPANGEGGYFLEDNLGQVEAFGTNLLVTLLTSTTGTVATAAAPDGTGSRTLFSSNLSSLVVKLTNGSHVAYTKPSYGLDGYAFLVGRESGAFSRVLGPLKGLAVLPSPSGTKLLYSYMDRNTLKLALIDRETNTSTPLPLPTLAEKCVWTPDETGVYCGVPTTVPQGLPDTWYQGAVRFTDRLWRVNLSARVAELVIDPALAADTSIDMIGLSIDQGADVITFSDKLSGALFVYDL